MDESKSGNIIFPLFRFVRTAPSSDQQEISSSARYERFPWSSCSKQPEESSPSRVLSAQFLLLSAKLSNLLLHVVNLRTQGAATSLDNGCTRIIRVASHELETHEILDALVVHVRLVPQARRRGLETRAHSFSRKVHAITAQPPCRSTLKVITKLRLGGDARAGLAWMGSDSKKSVRKAGSAIKGRVEQRTSRFVENYIHPRGCPSLPRRVKKTKSDEIANMYHAIRFLTERTPVSLSLSNASTI